MNRDVIQKIFIVFVGIVFIAFIGVIIFYFYSEGKRLDGYRADPEKKVFMEKIDKINAKSATEIKGSDLLDLGNYYNALKEYDKALSNFKKALDTDVSDVAQDNIANTYMLMKNYKEAEKTYLKMLKSKPGDTSLYIKLADLYKIDWKGKTGDTLGILLQGYGAYPKTVDILTNLADYYEKAGDKQKAIEYYKKAIEIDPNNQAVKSEIENLSK